MGRGWNNQHILVAELDAKLDANPDAKPQNLWQTSDAKPDATPPTPSSDCRGTMPVKQPVTRATTIHTRPSANGRARRIFANQT